MSETPQHTVESAEKKNKWQPIWDWVKYSGLIGLLIFAGVILLGIGLFAYKTPDPNQRISIIVVGILGVISFVVTVINAVSSIRMADIMERQEIEMTNQRMAMREGLGKTQELLAQNAEIVAAMKDQVDLAEDALKGADEQRDLMQGQLEVMREGLEQTDKMFYMANRAYIGVDAVGVYDAVTGKQGFPAHGKFIVICHVINKGKTPALNLRNAFGGALVGRYLPREHWKAPDFVTTGRVVPQVLPEQNSPIIGDPTEIEKDVAAAIVRGDTIFIVSTKFDFNCLGVKDEIFIVHHVWDHKRNTFMESGNWPPDVRLADPDDASQADQTQ